MTLTRLSAIRQRGTMHNPNIRRKTARMNKAGLRALVPGLAGAGLEMPDMIEFLCSDKFLHRGQTLYPRQATFLKVATLQKELLTDYDYDVLGQWSEGFRLPEPGEYTVEDEHDQFGFVPTGALAHGIQPDWERRMDLSIAEGRPWFREVQAVLGRRASKGFMGGVLSARVVWHYLLKGDPQGFYGIDEDKRLLGIVFAGKRSQAKENQWKDIANVILGAPCFQPYISRPLSESLTIFAPNDALREERLIEAGIINESDLATFEIVPRESTLMAGRGPTSFLQVYDEMAHVVATGANRSAEEVYDAAVPALDQFGTDGFIYVGSSPWQMTGKLYENYQLALGADPLTREPNRPDMLMLQLPSWALYEDWQYAHNLPMRPGDKSSALGPRASMPGTDPKVQVAFGPNFPKLKRAIQAYDEQMKRLERANPDTFKVERLAQWASSMHGYLDETKIAAMWDEWPPGSGTKLEMQNSGRLSVDYVAHGDPSKVNDSFGWVLAHREGPDINGLFHVVVDQIHAWHPSDYDDSTIDYIAVEADIIERAKAFRPSMLTFDQFNSAGMIQRIRKALDESGGPKRTQVEEVTATAKLNWKMAETLKAALNMGLVHAPHHELLELELRFLQLKAGRVDHPSSGPVQSKDVADALIHCVSHLIGEQMGVYLKGDLANLSPSGSQQAGASDAEVFGALGAGIPRGSVLSSGGLRGHVRR